MQAIPSYSPGDSDAKYNAATDQAAFAKALFQAAVRDGLRSTLANVQAAAKAEDAANAAWAAWVPALSRKASPEAINRAEEASARADDLFTTACRGVK